MEKHTKNGGTGIEEKPARIQHQNGFFKPRATLLLDILPNDGLEATNPQISAVSAAQDTGQATEEPSESEDMLKRLLINTEASAQRIQSVKAKWQMATLVLGLLLVPATVIIWWLFIEINSTGTEQGRLEIETQSLKEQLNTAGVQITGLKKEIETMLSRNLELVSDNAMLKSPRQTASVKTTAVTAKAEQIISEKKVASIPLHESGLDAGRMEAMRKATYPRGTSKAELTAVLGEPDRIYKSRKYEQLVYFNRKPGRFWFIGGQLVQTDG